MKPLTFFFFSGIMLFSCHNKESESDRILREFDSVNRELKKLPVPDSGGYKGVGGFRSLSQAFGRRQSVYDSVIKKLQRKKEYEIVLQMQYEVGEFYLNLDDLQRRFFIACGDSTGTNLPGHNEENLSITNGFFGDPPATYLLSWLLNAKKSLMANTVSDSVLRVIKNIGKLDEYKSSYTAEYWGNKYFKDVPPVAAITILNSFESQIKNIEAHILSEYLKQ
jgi:GldM N-terminal domain